MCVKRRLVLDVFREREGETREIFWILWSSSIRYMVVATDVFYIHTSACACWCRKIFTLANALVKFTIFCVRKRVVLAGKTVGFHWEHGNQASSRGNANAHDPGHESYRNIRVVGIRLNVMCTECIQRRPNCSSKACLTGESKAASLPCFPSNYGWCVYPENIPRGTAGRVKTWCLRVKSKTIVVVRTDSRTQINVTHSWV